MPRPEYVKDGKYKAWRRGVLERDGHKCRFCGSKRTLHVHHVKPWATHPDLRFSPSNGVTLCKKCHDQMAGREEDFEQRCLEARGAMDLQLMRLRARFQKDEDDATDGA